MPCLTQMALIPKRYTHPGGSIPARWRRNLVLLALSHVLAIFHLPGALAQVIPPWPPISKEELELKDNPQHPGDAAIILYSEVQTDNGKALETHFTRIKVFQEQGKKYGDIEIPYFEDRVDVRDIRARTVAPDGRATEFSGMVFDKVVVKTRRYKLSAKAFSLPNVQPGSIIEYSYSLHFHAEIPDLPRQPGRIGFNRLIVYPAAQWIVRRELFVRRAHFVLHPFSPRVQVLVRVIELPKIAPPERQANGVMQLDVENVPGIHEEEYSLPEDARQGAVYLFYALSYASNEGYWQDLARIENYAVERFISPSKAIRQEVERLISPGDAPETELRKLYERVQQIRAVNFEPTRTEKERKQEDLKPNKTAEDVLTRGYAFANQINLLFVALAREAGFTAYVLRITSRNRNLFHEALLDPYQLDADVVEVRLQDKTLYLDPGTPHCPFDLLPWEDTDTQGIRLALDGGLVEVPQPASVQALTERTARLSLDKEGNLDGKLEVSFTGQEALIRRLSENNKDEAGRKDFLEQEIREWLPQGATVKLDSVTGWEGSTGPLHATFSVQILNFAVPSGERLLLSAVIVHSKEAKAFQTSQRENPVYLRYGYETSDELTLRIPDGFKIESLPAVQGAQTSFGSYAISIGQHGSVLTMKRKFVMHGYYFEVKRYPEIRDFYDFVRANDDEQIILHAAPGN
jgi:hypothetical protein